MQLTACRALISGASGGIGQALVEQLCAGGAQLLLTGRDQAALEALQKRFPTQISLVCADLSQADGRAQVVHAARAFAPLNCLINAAGINQFCLFAEQDEQAIDRLITLNVSAPLQLTRQLLPLLQAQPQALVSALLKLYEDNAATLTPDPLYARFYYSHPPAVERIAHLNAHIPPMPTAATTAQAGQP